MINMLSVSSSSKHEVGDSYNSCRYCDAYDKHLACFGLWVEDRLLALDAVINLSCGSTGATGLCLLGVSRLLLIRIDFA